MHLSPDLNGVLAEGGLRALGVAVVEVLQRARRSHPVCRSTGKGEANLAHNLRKPALGLCVPTVRKVFENAWEGKVQREEGIGAFGSRLDVTFMLSRHN